jgi:uncharacterized protein (DUF488 family)
MIKSLFTLGYQQREVPEFVAILKANQIEIVADIRANPNSRKKGFSKKALQAELERNGIRYIHIPELGPPQDLRDKVRADNNYESFFKSFETYLNKNKEPLEQIYKLAIKESTCLLCFERDINECHRKSVAGKLIDLHKDAISIVHLS